jgi:hypothetical protein
MPCTERYEDHKTYYCAAVQLEVKTLHLESCFQPCGGFSYFLYVCMSLTWLSPSDVHLYLRYHLHSTVFHFPLGFL